MADMGRDTKTFPICYFKPDFISGLGSVTDKFNTLRIACTTPAETPEVFSPLHLAFSTRQQSVPALEHSSAVPPCDPAPGCSA